MTDPLFRERPPEAAAQQLAIVVAWLAECQLATLEAELSRQREICDRAVSQCKALGVPPVGLRGHQCVRLAERLKSLKEAT